MFRGPFFSGHGVQRIQKLNTTQKKQTTQSRAKQNYDSRHSAEKRGVLIAHSTMLPSPHGASEKHKTAADMTRQKSLTSTQTLSAISLIWHTKLNQTNGSAHRSTAAMANCTDSHRHRCSSWISPLAISAMNQNSTIKQHIYYLSYSAVLISCTDGWWTDAAAASVFVKNKHKWRTL